LLVEYANEGKIVLRLKGGDVSVFSNILDELEALIEHGIPYEVVPGISAALGAAACSGIPLTARGYSTAVRFLTFYKSDVLTSEYWKELAQTSDTLVFYMSSETIDGVVSNLVTHEISPDKLLAVVEQATTPYQKVHISSLYEFESNLKGIQLASPSLIIIGKVVNLHEQFSWLTNSESNELYFDQVSAAIKNLITPRKEKLYAGRA